MADLCAHCGYERVKSANSPIAFCQTPKCAGNPWGGTDDGQLDPQPTRVMEQPPEHEDDQPSFGSRVIEKAVEKAKDGIAEKVEKIHEERIEETRYQDMTITINYVCLNADNTYDEIVQLLREMEQEGRIGLVQAQYEQKKLKKGTNDTQ